MDALRLAILGVGAAGGALASFVDEHADLELVAVADTRAGAVQSHESLADLEFLGSVDELIAADQVDAVYVATPTVLHADHVTALAAAGKHCIV